MDKAALRLSSQQTRDSIPLSEALTAAQKVLPLFLEQKRWMEAQVIATYEPIRGELDPRPLAAALKALGKTLCLPAIEGGTLLFRAAQEPFVKGAFDIRQPAPSNRQWEPDLLLLPCLAFDKHGTRLGYGAGHYDRALAHNSSTALKIGFAYACQHLPLVPKEKHDVPLDAILTEEGIFFCAAVNQ